MQIVSLSGGNGKTERAVIEHVALPHPRFRGGKPSSPSPYKGEEKDWHSFLPLFCKEG
jgi:hypothetical protein